METTGARLEEVQVENLKDENFYGIAKLRIGQASKEIDARPSDALAVRVGCPIYVSEEVFEKAGFPMTSFDEKFGPDIQGIDSILKDLEITMYKLSGKLKADNPEPEV